MVPEGSLGVDRVIREVWKTLSVPTGTPRWAWEPSGGRGMDDLAARLAHQNTPMQNIQARQVVAARRSTGCSTAPVGYERDVPPPPAVHRSGLTFIREGSRPVSLS